jgi:phosphatidylethanolamine/phosphatidyl-N-methylethanolamine N-methyltransferase
MAKRPPNPRKGRHSTERPPLDGVFAFISQAIKNNRFTGAVLPSSSMLAKAMTKSLRQHAGPKRLLEVGPGTGPFTRYMLEALRAGDELHVVEINPAFARRLEKTLLQPFRRTHPKVVVDMHCEPIQTAALDGRFDYIVCGLPFNNFPPAEVRSIFRQLLELLKPGGELAYFEYAGVRIMKGAIVDEEGRRKLKRIHLMGRVLSRRHRGRRELVLGNMPPAVAVRLTR